MNSVQQRHEHDHQKVLIESFHLSVTPSGFGGQFRI